MMLYRVTWYPGYRFFSFARSGAYFAVFSSVLTSRFSIHGHLISISDTSLYNGGISSVRRNQVALFIRSRTLVFIQRLRVDSGVPTRFLGVYQINNTSKNRTFSALLWRFRYLVCAGVEQPAKMCCTLSGPLPQSRHLSSSVVDVSVFLLQNILVCNSCWYSACAPTIVCVGAVLHWWNQAKHSSTFRLSSSHLLFVTFPCHFSRSTLSRNSY